MKVIRGLLVGLMILISCYSQASVDDIFDGWNQIKLSSNEENIKVDLIIERSRAALTKVSLEWTGKKVIVPALELKGIDFPNITTVKLLSGRTHFNGATKQYRFVQMLYGDKLMFGRPKIVEFYFNSDGYIERLRKVQTSNKVLQFYLKLPGKNEIKDLIVEEIL